MSTLPHIEIDHLTKSYGSHAAVRDLSLTLRPGELFCFLGPNGAGKSTTINTLMGLKSPTSGDIRINGVSVLSPEIHAVRRRIGYVPEQPVLYDFLTGREFLHFVGELYEVDAADLRRIDPWLARFGLAAEADTLIRTYSMGMRKKIAFLAALVPDPEILVLDEPTGALDAASARAVKDVMLESRDAGKLVFFTTHVMEIAERFADRIAILDQGTLRAEGSMAELRARYGLYPSETLENIFLRLTTRDQTQST